MVLETYATGTVASEIARPSARPLEYLFEQSSIMSDYCGASARFLFQPKQEDHPSSMLIDRAVSRVFYNIIGKSVSYYGGTLPSSRDAAAPRYQTEH
jgi:hypothetical protein